MKNGRIHQVQLVPVQLCYYKGWNLFGLYLSENYAYLFCLDVYLNKFYDADMEAKGKGKYIIVNIKVISITINSFHLLKKKKLYI